MQGRLDSGAGSTVIVMDRERVWDHTVAERLALAEILRGLPEEAWDQQSLCSAWRIRDVAAHLIAGPQLDWGATLRVLPGLWRGPDGMIREDAIRRGAAPIAEILDQYDRFAELRRGPAVVTHVEPLIDVLVHTQDIARPLGIEHHMPPEAAAVAADRALRLRMAGRRLQHAHLKASDVAWESGTGALIEGPMEELLMLCAGREPDWDRLSGTL